MLLYPIDIVSVLLLFILEESSPIIIFRVPEIILSPAFIPIKRDSETFTEFKPALLPKKTLLIPVNPNPAD